MDNARRGLRRKGTLKNFESSPRQFSRECVAKHRQEISFRENRLAGLKLGHLLQRAWYGTPIPSRPAIEKYITDLEYFVVKRRVELFGFNSDFKSEYILWLTRGRFACWYPVLKKFMPEGEILRQEHWFHNGDGSAQQRYYYTQNEMLDRHGLANVATGARLDRNNVIVYPWTEDDDSADVANVRVRTAIQVVDEKFREAELSGKIINLE